ncbi:MAG: hypothetical protein ACOX6D_06970 [Thermoguttaceae bacterium]|jgi:hypothetical protein
MPSNEEFFIDRDQISEGAEMSSPEKPETDDRSLKPLDGSLLGGTRSFTARRSYYFFRSLLFGFLYTALVLTLLCILALIAVGLWVRSSRKPISVRASVKAQSVQLSGWLAFNDIQKQTPEVRENLVKKYVNRLDKLEQAEMASPFVVRAIPYIKQAAAEYLRQRDDDLIARELASQKGTISLPDYKITSGPDSGRYILSSEIQPTDALSEKIRTRKNGDGSKDTPLFPTNESQIESNIRTLTKEFFLRHITIYDNRSDKEKPACILECARTLNRFSALYDKARTELGLPPQGSVEQIRDLNHIVSGWIDTTSPEDLARLYWFKDVMVAVIIAERSGKTETAIEPLITHVSPDKSSGQRGGLLRGLFGSGSSPKFEKADSPASESETKPAEVAPAAEKPEGGIDFF